MMNRVIFISLMIIASLTIPVLDGQSKTEHSISENGLTLIKNMELWEPKLYNDQAGHCTIGWGHLVHKGRIDGRDSEKPFVDGITPEQGLELLKSDASTAVNAVNSLVTVPLTQNQFDALVSFTFNEGDGAFKGSTLLKELNSGKYEKVPSQLGVWNKIRDKKNELVVCPDLVARRQSEANLFQKDELGGVNFTSIGLNYISLTAGNSGSANFSYVLKAEKVKGISPEIDVTNSTLISMNALMTGLVVPNDKFWVNLNPWEPDRIIDERLGHTDVGRIMLEADLQMKKDFSNYENPCSNKTSKALYDLLNEKSGILVRGCMDKFPGEIENARNVQFGAATRLWIVPDKVYAYVNGSQIYIINATLTIYSEPVSEHSYFVLSNQDTNSLSKSCTDELDKSSKEYGQYVKDLEDKMILPYVVKDVNYGEKYKDLRNIYISLALAQWYKSSKASQIKLQDSSDPSKNTSLEALNSWKPTDTWDKYVYSYKNGEFNCWQNKTTNMDKLSVIETTLYKSGGVVFDSIIDHIVLIKGVPPEVQEQVENAIDKGIIDAGTNVLFGNSINVDLENYAPSSSGKDLNRMSEPILRRSITQPIPLRLSLPTQVKLALGPETNSGGIQECGKCPFGYEGPDENCTCYQIHHHGHNQEDSSSECGTCPAGYQGPDENCSCWKWETKMVNKPGGCGTCPPGYLGPDENCMCRQEIQGCGDCPSGYEGPDKNCMCSKTVTSPVPTTTTPIQCGECPAGYRGPDANCECSKCGECPAGYEGPDANCECSKWVTVYE